MESLLSQMNAGDGADPHTQLQQAASQLTPDQFHAAAAPALETLPAADRGALTSLLGGAGAAQGAGVAANATDGTSLAKMLHWVQTNVPGGIPAVLGAVGVAGGAAAVAGSGQGGNLLSSVLGSVLPAVTNAASKLGA